MDEKERMKELVATLNEASKAYYSGGNAVMTDHEYDALYNELLLLEEKTGTVMSNSPTQHVGYDIVSSLPKEKHPKPMLSLDKTKSRETLAAFIGDNRSILSWKMDGETVVLTYRDGKLFKGVTRGNGIQGEVITQNARVFRNIPVVIPYKGELVVRGEAVIRYSDFNRINSENADRESLYKNPRNLCSGSVRQLDSSITASRCINFYAFALVKADGIDFRNSHEKEYDWLSEMGFTVVGHRIVTKDDVGEAIDWFSSEIKNNDFPSDGLVALYDDIAYGESLGTTAKFPRNGFAFKWKDEEAKTILREIEWNTSRTGTINPVAKFDPVELEGTTVRRASVHNVSVLREMKLGIGDEISVFKANMIIPQIAKDYTESGNIVIPDVCPVCGEQALLRKDPSSGVMTLYCPNPGCTAKKIKAFTLFGSRDALDITGLSEQTFEKLIGRGLIHSLADIFRLKGHRKEIVDLDGFGEKSFTLITENIEKSRTTDFVRLVYGLGIPNVGLSCAKLLNKAFGGDFDKLRNCKASDLARTKGIGPVIAEAIEEYFRDAAISSELDDLLKEITIAKEESGTEEKLSGKTYAITGSLQHFGSRSELVSLIESLGGNVSSSVTAKTSFLINNDRLSGSSKNKSAQKLGVGIITEEEFLESIKDGK